MGSSLATYTPAPEVRVAGRVPDGFAELLVAATVEESVTGLARCEVRLDNWGASGSGAGYVFDDRSVVDFADEVEVAFGPPDERATVFHGRLTAIEAQYGIDTGPTVVLLAEDALQDLRMTRRTRTFEEVSDADVVRSIASDHDLTADVDLDLDGPTHTELSQLNQSDLAFLRERVLPHGVDVWLDGTTLHVGDRDDDPIVLRHGRELLSFRVIADLAVQATEQRVAGWDVAAKEAVLETATPSSVGGDLGSDLGGGDLLAEKFGERPATTTLHRTTTSTEARTIATGLYRERARRFVTGSGTTDGVSGLRAGRGISLDGLGRMFDGDYRLTRVVHRYDTVAGYRTEIEVERAGISS
jgi:phage protein D